MSVAGTVVPGSTRGVGRSVFSRLRGRVRRGIQVEGIAWLLTAAVAFVVVSYLVDRTLRLEIGYRASLLVGFGALLVYLTYRHILRPLRFELNDDELALAVERGDPAAREGLISAVQFERSLDGLATPEQPPRRAESEMMMRKVIDDVGQRIGSLAVDRALDGRRVARFAGLVGGLALGLGGWIALDGDNLALWAQRNLGLSSTPWPRATQLEFIDLPSRVASASDVEVVVRAAGVIPEQTALEFRFAGGDAMTEQMSMTGSDEFRFTISALLESVELQATGGDGWTEPARIEIVPRPRVDSFGGEIEFPSYMERSVEPLKPGVAEVSVPTGSKLRLRGRSSKALREAALIVGEAGDQRLSLAVDGQSFAGELAATETTVLRLELRDLDDLDAGEPPRLLLRVVPDQAPTAKFRVREVGSMLTPHALVPGELELLDDFGVRTLKIEYKLSGVIDENGEKVTPDTDWVEGELLGLDGFRAGLVEFEDRVGFDLRALNPDEDFDAERNTMRPGQFLTLRFVVTDNFGPGDPHRGESDPLSFRLVTREVLIEDLARRQSEAKRELKQAVVEAKAARQELTEILSPTSSEHDADARTAARQRLTRLSRAQRARARVVTGVATRYDLILFEFENNRLLEPNKVASLRTRIVTGLEDVATELFPPSADAVTVFAETGTTDARQAAVASYDKLLERLEAILEQMDEVESFGQLVEYLRRVIELQDDALRGAAKRRKATMDELFGPDGGGDAPQPGKTKSGRERNGRERDDK